MKTQIQSDHQIPTLQAIGQSKDFEQNPYRWVVVMLAGLTLILNGIANNAIIPLQHKIALIYEISQAQVSVSIIITFLIFSLVNFPVNHVIDSSGLRITFLAGAGLYAVGTLLYVFIEYSYYFVILGTVFIGLGQPFLLNSPSKVAAIWFFPKNRALAIAIMVGINLLGMGIGFLLPALVVDQQNIGEDAKSRIFWLYLSYFILAIVILIFTLLFMKAKPKVSPSESAEAKRLSSPMQSLKIIQQNPNLWKFFLGFQLIYGTFIAFASNCNFLIKPYGYTDVEIAVNAVVLMGAGVIGSITFSLYIKKTFNYGKAIRTVAVGSVLLMTLLCFWLNTSNGKVVTTIIIAAMGFIITPIIPICYELGSELAFPMGEAQVTGLLNGAGMFWAFVASSTLSSVFGYGSKQSSLHTMEALFLFILVGSILFFLLKIKLKKQDYENELTKTRTNTDQQIQQQQPDTAKQIKQCTDLEIPEMLQPSGISQSDEYLNYNIYRLQNMDINLENL